MQVIAPDFFASIGGSSSARDDQRAGDGLFDALLREEESRHTRDPLPPRDRQEAARPARERVVVEEPRPEARDADEPRREEPTLEKPAETAAEDSAAAEPRERPAESTKEKTVAHNKNDDDSKGDDDGGAVADSGNAETTVSVAIQVAVAAPTTPAAKVSTIQATGEADQTASAAPAATKNAGNTVAQTLPGAKTAAQAAATTAAPSATPPTDDATKAAASETTPQPASAAAAALRAADKASPTATTKQPNQVAEAHRHTPTQASAQADSRPAGERKADAAPAAQPGVSVSTQATVEARPAAALGGAAATAALAQQGANTSDTQSGTPDGNGQQAQGDNAKSAQGAKAVAQVGQPAKGPELLTAAADKVTDSAGPGSSQVQSPTLGGAPAGPAGPAPLHQTSFGEALASARHGQAANPAQQVAVQIHRAQVDGHDRISIKLHPAELGRIDVKLEHAHDGTLRAVISADRSETLDLLQRDARGLERALQDAGLKTDSGSLNFNLRGQHQGQNQQASDHSGTGRGGAGVPTSGGVEAAVQPAPVAAYGASHSGALDIRV